MKKLFNMVRFHIKRLITSPSYIGIFFIMPLITSSLFIFIDIGKNKAPSPIGQATLIFMGEGNESLKGALKKEGFEENIMDDMEASMKSLSSGDAGSVYRIGDNYIKRLEAGEKPVVDLYVRNEATKSVVFETTFRSIIHKTILNNTLLDNKLIADGDNLENYLVNKVSLIENNRELETDNSTLFVVIILLSFYIIMGGGQVSYDLVNLKKNNSLKRAVISPNSSLAINLALFIAYATFMLLANFIIFATAAVIYKASSIIIYRAVLIIVLSMIFSLSLGLVLFRIFKEPPVAIVVGMIISMILMGFSIMEILLKNPLAKSLAYISPLTWIMQILDKGKIFPASLIILLLSAALFTSGSYKLETYVNK